MLSPERVYLALNQHILPRYLLQLLLSRHQLLRVVDVHVAWVVQPSEARHVLQRVRDLVEGGLSRPETGHEGQVQPRGVRGLEQDAQDVRQLAVMVRCGGQRVGAKLEA